MRRRLRNRATGGAVLLVICVGLALPTAASAATTDFAYGAGISTAGTPFAFSARSAPDGSRPAGRAILGGVFGNAEGPVTCLRVAGNLAVIGYRIERASVPSLIGKGYVGYLQDNGAFTNHAPVDKGDAAQAASAPTTCPAADASRASFGLYGEAVVENDSTLPPPPADPTWSISKGTIPTVGFYDSFNVAAMRIADGSAIGYGELNGPEGRPLDGRVLCLDVDGRTAITGIETDSNRSLVSDVAAQITAIDGSPDSLSIDPVSSLYGEGEPGQVECKPPYSAPRELSSGAVIARSGEPLPPPPVRCGQTIRRSTTLQSDLACDRSGLTIGAPGITLDLAGHTLSSSSGAVILNQGYDDVTIKNGFVGVSNEGIVLQGVSGNVIRDVSLAGLQVGIELTGSDHNRIVSNRLSSVWIALQNGSDDNLIRANTVLAYEGLIAIGNSSRNRVVGNVISDALETSVSLYGADHTLVSGNDITAIDGRGVGLYRSDDNQVSDNTVHGKPNGENPVEVEGAIVTDSHRNLMLRNSFFDTTTAIHVVSGWANELRRNQALYGLEDGFLVDATAVGTILLRNAAFAHGDDGFDIRASSTRLGHNGATYNGGYGIRAVPGVVDLGGNLASNNAGPAQCLNVACH